MKANFGELVNVPLECDDISKTILQLPRHPEDAEIVAVKLKRKLELKNSHLEQFIRPKVIVKALETIKASGNPFYQDIEINENFMEKAVEGAEQPSDMETDSQIREKELDEQYERAVNQAKEAINEKENGNKVTPDENEESDDEVDTRLQSVKKYQSKQNGNTCLFPRDISNEVFVNTEKTAIKRSAEEGKKSIQIAPGINKKCCLF